MQPKPEWSKPFFVEIDMNAEIGGYQADDPDANLPAVRQQASGEVVGDEDDGE